MRRVTSSTITQSHDPLLGKAHCISIIAIEGSAVLATVDNEQGSPDEGLFLLQIDVSSSDSPVLLKSKLPNRPTDVLFMASAPGCALVRTPNSADFLGESLCVMNADGSVRQLDHDGENFTVRLAVGTGHDTDGKSVIALYESPAAAALGPTDKIILLDLETNH